jgi:hypothetical protein
MQSRHDGSDSMANKKNITDVDRARAQRHLRELIAALDRRLPQVERCGEAEIARAATALRKKAEQRLADLEAESDRKAH